MCCLLGQSLDEHIRGFEISKLYLLEISFENRCYTFSEPELKADACETVISWHKLGYGVWRQLGREFVSQMRMGKVTLFIFLQSC